LPAKPAERGTRKCQSKARFKTVRRAVFRTLEVHFPALPISKQFHCIQWDTKIAVYKFGDNRYTSKRSAVLINFAHRLNAASQYHSPE
jgi:hypothetical protein